MEIKNIVKNNSGDTVGYDIVQNGITYENISIDRLKNCTFTNAVYVGGSFPYIRGKLSLPIREIRDNKNRESIKLVNKDSTTLSKGALSKATYKVGNKIYIVKGNSKGHCEPFAEYIGGNLAGLMLQPNKNVKVMACKLDKVYKYREITNYNNFKFVSLNEHWGRYNTLTFNRYVEQLQGKKKLISYTYVLNNCNNILRYQIATMMFIDAILGNVDRHTNNWDIDIDTLTMPAIIDFGGTCLSVYLKKLNKVGQSMYPDYCKPFEVTHIRQLELITSLRLTERPVILNNPVSVIQKEYNRIVQYIRANTTNTSDYLDKLYEYLIFRSNLIVDKFRKYLDIRDY